MAEAEIDDDTPPRPWRYERLEGDYETPQYEVIDHENFTVCVTEGEAAARLIVEAVNDYVEDWGSIAARAPEMPGDTCPLIDRIGTRFDAVAFDLDRVRAELLARKARATDAWSDELKATVDAVEGLRQEIETVRTANKQLRK